MNLHVRRRGASSARRRVRATIVALLAISACRGPRPTIVAPAPSSARLLQFQRTIDAKLADGAVTRATWGVAVRSLTRGDALYTRNAEKLLMPASTMKVVTLAAAIDRLGWNHSYRTTAYTLGTVDGGVLDGDLLIVGGGDPTIENWLGHSWLDTWTDSLRAQGIRAITGRVIGDDNVFDDDGLGAGWMWDDLGTSFSAPVSGLQFNQNSAQVLVTPAASFGDTPAVEINPAWAPLTLRNLLTTTGPETPAAMSFRGVPRSPVLELRGGLPAHSPRVTRTVSVPNPTLYFAAAARDALVRGSIEVRGPAVDLDDIEPPDRRGATLLTEYISPLESVAKPMMKLSANLYAETLLKTLGAQVSASGSTDAGRSTVRTVLTEWGINAADVVMADGSGLSRYNLITPGALVATLATVFQHDEVRDRFVGVLPVAGVDGTLAERMKGTAAEGNARAKTGSVSNARALAGYVTTAEGEPLAFSIMANNSNVDASTIDAVTDAIVVALAEFSRR